MANRHMEAPQHMTDTTGDKPNKYYKKRRKRIGANRSNSGVMRVKHSTHVLVSIMGGRLLHQHGRPV